MADFADDASAVEELQRNAALSAHRINRDAVSAVKCEECGDRLPEARRKAYPGCTMSVSCQDDAERRNRRM
ncbi:TraR/DksA C4-type zinc finger protein [Citrobacter sp. RHBSTW-00678]|uniref:TraR/DksA C4-type zinc finger protein n=1 Tax=Citrobacter sp. RHBSTW-00678 TaxID=2742661 RepID=UPI0015E90C31|nr:TraR/DksA C4-type zinc finger protein [Citrobacter sp. RHBSTW-00678]QLV88356.1 TraR/DksA C4-type zinc finger protein [Citrobacter sp. RHBSTW-00678]